MKVQLDEGRGLYVPWGTDCLLCKKRETIGHTLIDCCDDVLYWDVLQRMLQKDMLFDAYGVQFFPIVKTEYPYDLSILVGLEKASGSN